MDEIDYLNADLNDICYCEGDYEQLELQNPH